ncbi:MAG TPA: PAS domain S-box protein [Prosthecobacter sp.]|nr:PAS domain S-box protein [Prosthecobacter sp.]
MAVLKSAGALMLVADAQGKVVSVNPACERLLGFSLREIGGKPFSQVFLADTPGQMILHGIGNLAAGAAYEREAYVKTRGGERRFIAWSIAAQINEGGAIDYIIASGMDITERRRLEQEILEVSDREQRRIGQDLHDGLCQVLAGITCWPWY